MRPHGSEGVLKSTPIASFGGVFTPPGDKSISQRALIFASIATGPSLIKHFLPSEDCLNTLSVLQLCGVSIHRVGTEVQVQGLGLRGLKEPVDVLDFGNSGTGFRLCAGILAAQPFASRLIGDLSLQRRPMARILEPLRKMGAKIDAESDRAPFLIHPAVLNDLEYDLPVASAQVKSCLLLAGLVARKKIKLTVSIPTRDHTERLLTYFDLPFVQKENQLTLMPVESFPAKNIQIPGDFSSAAFFIAFCAAFPGMSLKVSNVGLNPLRIGLLSVLTSMGASIQWGVEQDLPEPIGWIQVKGQLLKGVDIPVNMVPACIDEFPAIWLAAAFAEGPTRVRGVSELRVKESDRLLTMSKGLQAVGIAVEVFEDGLTVIGGKVQGGVVESHGDHRIAMAFLMMGARSESFIEVQGCDCIATSFPNFVSIGRSLGLKIEEVAE